MALRALCRGSRVLLAAKPKMMTGEEGGEAFEVSTQRSTTRSLLRAMSADKADFTAAVARADKRANILQRYRRGAPADITKVRKLLAAAVKPKRPTADESTLIGCLKQLDINDLDLSIIEERGLETSDIVAMSGDDLREMGVKRSTLEWLQIVQEYPEYFSHNDADDTFERYLKHVCDALPEGTKPETVRPLAAKYWKLLSVTERNMFERPV